MAIHRVCMRDHIRNAIVARILDGSSPPGTRLKEMSLAREFNVSQAPVREALRELEALGLLESERYRGTRVRSIDLDELREAYELRAAIEEAAARRAVPCSRKDLERLESDLKLMQRAAREHDRDAYMDSAVNFHRHVVQMSGNELFLRAWEHMAWDIRARIAVQRIGLIGVFAKERKAVIAALRAGDGEKAGRRLREIIAQLLVRLTQIHESQPAAPKGGPLAG
ncbi:MAG TPA: GntR family transcriptional regulator [Nevskia sp.]|nr:GntR family transcriptional regulator [Nevskia sp.]